MSTPRLTAAVALAIVLLSVLAFAPLREYRFIQDDHPLLQLNPVIHRGDAGEILRSDYWGGVGGGDRSLYRPVTLLSFLPERNADGRVEPGRAHVTNIALHALVSLLLFALGLRLGAGPLGSAVAALLFAVHPLHISAVAPLTGRAEILALLFALAALWCQTWAGPWPGRPTAGGAVAPRIAAWSSGLLVFLALGSKEVAVAAPLLLVVLEWVYRRPAGRRDWIERAAALAPTGLAVAGHLALRAVAVGGLLRTQDPPLSDNPLVALEGLASLATRLGLAGRYLRQLLVPWPLSADYSGPVIAPETGLLAPWPLIGAGWLLLLAGLALVPLARRGTGPGAAAGFAAWLFLAPYLVVGNLVVLVGVIYAERLIYFPSAGFCLLLGTAVPAIRTRLARPVAVPLLLGALVAVLLAAAWQTRRETRHWRNEEALFTAALVAAPGNPRAHFTLGKIRLEQGRNDEALAHFRRTTELWPDFSAAWFEQGQLLANGGDLAAAADAFRRAAEINPRHAGAQLSLGMALRRLGRRSEAETQLRRTLRRFSDLPLARAELGHVLAESGRYAEAAAAFREAIAAGREDVRDDLARAERLAAEAAGSTALPRR